MKPIIKQSVKAIFVCLLACLPTVASATPGDILFSDDFDRNNLNPWMVTGPATAGILVGGQTSGSNPRAAYTSHGAVTVTSPTFNAAVPAARLDFWIRRGSDAFSEDTDAGEDFIVEYQAAGGGWNPVVTYLGAGTNGQIYNASFFLPGTALHANLAIRMRQTNGSGFDFDYWHFDDVVITETNVPGTLVIGTCDDFETGIAGNWNVNSNAASAAGVSAATANSPSNSLFLNGGVVSVTSNAIDTNDLTFSAVSVWVRRGSDAFSEDPDGGEDLVLEYRNDVGNWISLETFVGNGGQGQILNRTYAMPTSAQHASFQLRFRMTGGSGIVWDFWHIDDVCLLQNPDPILQVSKVASTISDPVNGTAGAKPIPGAYVQYTINVSNQGIGSADSDSVVITDPVPVNTALYVTTAGGDPISLVDGTPSSGLSYSFATDITFSSQIGGGPPYNYLPNPDADGFDALITGYRFAPAGSLNANSGGGNPNFNVVFRVRIE